MDGDEEQRSTAVAVCDGATGDGAEESGDAAPVTTEADLPAAGSATAVPADPADDGAAADDAEDAVPDEGADVEDEGSAAVDVGDDEVTDEPEAVDAAAVPVGAEPARSAPRRISPYPRRGVVALVVVGMIALAVSAVAGLVPSLEAANQQFVEAAQAQGYDIAPGEQETLVLSAARKICDRKVTHATYRERRSTALTSTELAAVGAAFGAGTRDFTALALDTYCSP